jgi:hypothetical protein
VIWAVLALLACLPLLAVIAAWALRIKYSDEFNDSEH